MPSKPAKPGRDLDRALDAMPAAYIECRDYGHIWRSRDAYWVAKERVYVQQLECARCATIRVRELNAHGHILSSGYRYADGYQMPAGTGFLTSNARDGIRLRSVTAAMPTRDERKHA